MSNVGKATDGMLDKISTQAHRIQDAYDFAFLAAEADPANAAFYREFQSILMGESSMGARDTADGVAEPSA